MMCNGNESNDGSSKYGDSRGVNISSIDDDGMDNEDSAFVPQYKDTDDQFDDQKQTLSSVTGYLKYSKKKKRNFSNESENDLMKTIA